MSEESKEKDIVQFSSFNNDNKVHKLHLDKYYTPREHADLVVEKTFQMLGVENVTEVVETSAGAGVFIDAVQDYLEKEGVEIPMYAYDIEPDREDVVKQNYLELYQEYKPGRLIIGNPPFGVRMQLAKEFYQKAVREADYVSWILPGSQFDNNFTLYEFDLTYSDLLGEVEYSGVKDVNSCFNLYERPATKVFNKRKKVDLNDVTITTNNSPKYKDITDYDIRMIAWGDVGRILEPEEKEYASEFKIKVHHDSLRDDVINSIKEFDWKNDLSYSAMPRVSKRIMVDVLKKLVPGIK